MKTVKDFNVKGKRVLLRAGFNVPLDSKGNILDDFRIQRVIPTIEYLLENEAKVILMTHLGEPDGKDEKLSTSVIQEKLMQYLDCSIVKANDCVGPEIKKWIDQMQNSEILLLENLRFCKGEKENDPEFAKQLTELGEIYINDAFPVSHREHASIVGVPKLLDSGIGLAFEKEIENLKKILVPKRPLIGVMGGAKLSSKIKPIKGLLEKVDYLLIGGKISDVILRTKGVSGFKGLSQKARELEKVIKNIDLDNQKLILPVDVKTSDNRFLKAEDVGVNDIVYDIGPKTIEKFCEIIKKGATVFWAGPVGKSEEQSFKQGSLEIAQTIADSSAFTVAGGRETILILTQEKLIDKFDFVSVGGGAMLQYLSAGTLPGIEAI